jgi:hypothetical protein
MSGGGPHETEDEFGREWSHRWVVRGHWREQWYPSEGVHRLIWIEAFVKGPEDRPLIIKDTVFSVVAGSLKNGSLKGLCRGCPW